MGSNNICSGAHAAEGRILKKFNSTLLGRTITS